MKKPVFAAALFIVVAVLIGLVASAQPLRIIHKTNTAADELSQSTVNAESGENHNLSVENEADAQQNKEYADASTLPGNTNQKEIATTDNTKEPLQTTSDQNANTDVPPPDGRIYWSPEPPYAYIPTCTPKNGQCQ